MKDVVKLAYLFDMSGNFILADKLDKIAQNNARVILADQGVYIPRGPNGESLLDMISKFTNDSIEMQYGKKTINISKLESLIKNSYLANFINKVELQPDGTGFYGTYHRPNKLMTINANFTKRDLENIVGTFEHETIHSVKPLDEAERRSQEKAIRKIYQQFTEFIELDKQKKVEEGKLLANFKEKIISREQYIKESNDLDTKYEKLYKNLEKKYQYKQFYAGGTERGRIPYFINEEILAQTNDIKRAFNVNILNEVIKRYYLPYNKDPKEFVDGLRSLIANFDEIKKIEDNIENDPQIQNSLSPRVLIGNLDQSRYPDAMNKYIAGDQDTLLLAEKLVEEQKRIIFANNLPQYRILKDIENVGGQEFIWKLKNINDPVYFEHIKKSLSNDLLALEQHLGLKQVHKPLRSETPQPKKQNVQVDGSSTVNQQTSQQKSSDTANQPRSTQISELTSQISQSKIKSTPKSKSSLSAILPTIKKLFKQLSEILQKNLDKFNNSPVGKVVNFAMLVKDIYFIVTLTDKISQQIEAGEDVMIKDQYDLGLTIVSLLTDQQTQAALRVIFPPIIPVLSNPQFQAWLVSINIGANVLSGLVSATDYLGTLMNTTNKSEGATSGVLNTPGSLQALVMPVFDLRDKYGEVYNALIDVEKGIPVPQAISKHIMKDASGGLEPYRLSLFYKFRENKPRILQYQKSAEFKKLPAQNQLLYPSANSAYAISSYRKARDAQARARQESYNRNFGPGSGGLSRNAQ